jgi:hypothetical protein
LTVDAFLKPNHQILHLLIRVPRPASWASTCPKEVWVIWRSIASIRRFGQPRRDDRRPLYLRERQSPDVTTDRVGARLLPFDTSFNSYETALSGSTGPALPVDTQIYWLQGSVDALIEYRFSPRPRRFVRTGLTGLRAGSNRVALFPPTAAFAFVSFLGDPAMYGSIRAGTKRTGLLQGRCAARPRHPRSVALRTLRADCFPTGCDRCRWCWRVGVGQFVTSLVIAYGPDATGVWLALVSTLMAHFFSAVAIENIASATMIGAGRLSISVAAASAFPSPCVRWLSSPATIG